ncbi:hypothetical protein BGW36DRAFT_399290 [Talaromyces proteolyticus]|uniref:GRF-type domain-containing protein n=1 Tax=Talaromyces proteolyticus TaxID=1131652 RepID=A0AAD4KK87_9EURO|nr:uncharacterized protein BGW36DRAFT_399290 [Talaromyces proteolyticus]KAH8694141.1 hypothetical protein BGW36DRAFT_399290 [Talaromyces proteolyticus]
MNRGKGSYQSPRPTTSWRGRYIDGVWHCDCEPRVPADRFQTKNGGINHGRWFYTCHKPQPKRCKFFLWESDAQVREKQTVLSNSVSKPITPKKTPVKSIQSGRGGLFTPSTSRTVHTGYPGQGVDNTTPSKIKKTRTLSSDEDAYSWDESLDDEVEDLMERKTPLRQPVFTPPETPRKTPRTANNTSPGKRKLDDLNDEPPPYSALDNPPPTSSGSRTNSVPFSSVEISTTPTPRRYHDALSANSSSEVSDLALDVLSTLDRHDVVIPTQARDEVVALLDKHHLKSQGLQRGRDILRVSLNKKDGEIVALKQRIEGLLAEREMDRTIIAGLNSRV